MRELSRREKTEFNKLQKRLRRNVGNAIVDYNMIEEGDREMVMGDFVGHRSCPV